MKHRDHQLLFPRPKEEVTQKDALLESMPESKHWDLLPGSEGRQAAESARDEEDSEGRSESEQIVDDGGEEAEREQVREAARLSKHNQ
jgi:hypothetical protein